MEMFNNSRLQSKGYRKLSNSEANDHGIDAHMKKEFQIRALRKFAILIIPIGTICLVGGLLNLLIFANDHEVESIPQKVPDHRAPVVVGNLSYPNLNLEECRGMPINMRIDCFPDDVNVKPETCHARGCCWQEVHSDEIPTHERPQGANRYIPEGKLSDPDDIPLNVPYCYYPSNYFIYNFTEVQYFSSGINAKLMQVHKSGFHKDVPVINVEIHYETCTRIRIIMYDLQRTRFRPTIPDLSHLDYSRCKGTKAYRITLVDSKGSFVISRSDTGVPIFDTRNAAPLIYADQFLQLSTILPSPYIYGLGQHLDGLLLDVYWKRRVFWNADMPPTPDANLYGSHPFYMVMEPSGSAHGVFLFNTNAMDVVLQPTPAATFHVIGGVIDLFVFLGPTPDNVVAQYTDVVGKPFLPPYWSLGYHQCRFGYQTLNNTKEVWKRTRDAQIPFDVQWNDIDYMVRQNDFTYSKDRFSGLPQFVDELHKEEMHYVIITDSGISAGEKLGTYPPYDLGIKYDIFVKNSSGMPFIGKVWNPKATVWPDFTHPMSLDYWHKLITDFHEEVAFDGLWIDMNEPANFWDGQKTGCPNNSLENPPYLPPVVGGKLAHRTLCMTAQHYLGLHYDLHNIYGLSEVIITYKSLKAMKNGRPFIISRSSYPGLSAYGGHWTGDVQSDWFNLWKSIGDTLTFNILGIPMVGADICGFNGNTTEALCNRWMQLGAFYPFARNHNTDDGIDQDPVALGPLVVNSSIKALTERYKLLPTLYTLFVRAHLTGMPVAKPLFFNYAQDVETYSLDTQFMWGESLMIAPVLKENATEVNVYFPAGRWYDMYNGTLVAGNGPKYLNISAPLNTIPLFVYGGHILPCHTPGSTTTAQMRNTPFGLIVALDEGSQAQGEMYWDNGKDIDSYSAAKYLHANFRVVANHLTSSFDHKGWKDNVKMILGWIKIYGIQRPVKEVFVNGRSHMFDYNTDFKVLRVSKLGLDFTADNHLTWNS